MTRKGPVEYTKKGSAPYILIFHGTPGMHDGVTRYFDRFVEKGMGVITVSRPGYGRTLPLVNSFAEQADVIAALVD